MYYNFDKLVIQAQDAHNTQRQQIEHLKQQTTATQSQFRRKAWMK